MAAGQAAGPTHQVDAGRALAPSTRLLLGPSALLLSPVFRKDR